MSFEVLEINMKKSARYIDGTHTPPRLTCSDCGDTHDLILPMSFTEMSKKITAFEVIHEDCGDREKAKKAIAEIEQTLKDNEL